MFRKVFIAGTISTVLLFLGGNVFAQATQQDAIDALQELSDAEDAATLAKEEADNERTFTVDMELTALDVRGLCVTEGATAAQLAAGDAHLSAGGTELGQGDGYMAQAATSTLLAISHFGAGAIAVALQNWGTAVSQFNQGTTHHNTAAQKYGDAFTLGFCSAYDEYSSAEQEFALLYTELLGL